MELIRALKDPLDGLELAALDKAGAYHMLLMPDTDLVLAWYPDRFEWLKLPTLEIVATRVASPQSISRGPGGVVLMRDGANYTLIDPAGEVISEFVREDGRTAEPNPVHQRIAIKGTDSVSLHDWDGNELFRRVISEETTDSNVQLCWAGKESIVTQQGDYFGVWSEDDVDFIFHDQKCQGAKFSVSPDGDHFARIFGTKTVAVFEGATCKEVASMKSSLGFGRFLTETTVAVWDDQRLVCWDYKTGEKRETKIVNPTRTFDVSSDEKYLWMKGIGDTYRVVPADATFPPSPPHIHALFVSPDGARYGVTERDEYTGCRVHDTMSGEEITRFSGMPFPFSFRQFFLRNGNAVLVFSSLDREKENVFVHTGESTKSMQGEIAYGGGDEVLTFEHVDFSEQGEVIRRDLNFEPLGRVELPENKKIVVFVNHRFALVQDQTTYNHAIYDFEDESLRPHFERARLCQIDGHFASWLQDDRIEWYDMAASELIGTVPRESSWVVSVPHEKLFYIDDQNNGRVWSRDGSIETWASFEKKPALMMSDDGEHLIRHAFRKLWIYRVSDLELLAEHESTFDVMFRACTKGVLVLLNRFGAGEVLRID